MRVGLKGKLRTAGRLALASREERRIELLARRERYHPGTVNLRGMTLQHVDAASFASAWKAIFLDGIYAFDSEEPPHIIDGGANIGLATLFWKHRWPAATIEAYEPDPTVYAALEANTAGLDGVELVQAALADCEGTARFHVEGADAGHLDDSGIIEVPLVRLRDRIDRPVDLLKLDVEGAETELLVDCADRLEHVRRVFVEWHSFADRLQTLDVLVHLLRISGMRVHVAPEFSSPRPFVATQTDAGMDNRVNLFAWRDDGRHVG